MRLAPSHGEPGVEVFVYGVSAGPFPARQHVEASRAVARLHGLDAERTIFVQQSDQAIAAGAFHNDVVAVANERVLFAHEQAFAGRKSWSPRASGWFRASTMSRCRPPKCRSRTRSDPTCSTPSL